MNPQPSFSPPDWSAFTIQATAFMQQAAQAAQAQAERDRRFVHPEWQANPWYRSVRDAYLMQTQAARAWVKQLDLQPKQRLQAEFFLEQFLDASAPTNFLATNPDALQKLRETKGASLQAGMQNLLGDAAKKRISMTDESVFEVGRNMATTEGAVIYRNALMELIQYTPRGKTVFEKPLLMVPPCINKYYIMDLQPENSLVRYALDQGHQVFLVSWKNPHEAEAHYTWDDYLELGPLAAIAAIQKISGQKTINTLGFCVGGTILSSALAVLAARGEHPAASLTLLATLLEFTDVGNIGAFVDEGQVALREAQFKDGGIMSGIDIGGSFSALRANDLVWNYVVNNYLKGETPPAFDLLYWNGDATNLPGPMYVWYLRNLYLEDRLKQGVLQGAGQTINLQTVTCPQYMLATREDHIVPWQTAFRSRAILGGNEKRFALGASGHIAGVINPPAKGKRSFWTVNDTAKTPKSDAANRALSAQAWLDQATETPGSWWTDWSGWLNPRGGKRVAAPKNLGGKGFAALEPAPGSYVKEKA